MADLRMPDLNTVIIAGNLTNDPSFGRTNDRTSVVNFHIASNRRYKDNKGNVREDVCFVGVVAWDALAESCRGRLYKGSPVLVSGELQSRKWKSDDGHNRTIVEIKARKIQFLDKYRAERSDQKDKETAVSEEPEAADALAEPLASVEEKPVEETPEIASAESESEPAVETRVTSADADVAKDENEKKKPDGLDFGYDNLKI